MAIFLNGVLALSKGVPKLNGLIATATNNLTIVGGERYGEHVLRVVFESAGRLADIQIPQAQGLVP